MGECIAFPSESRTDDGDEGEQGEHGDDGDVGEEGSIIVGFTAMVGFLATGGLKWPDLALCVFVLAPPGG